MEKVNSLKALKDPAHGWAISRLVDLIRNSLRRSLELAAEDVFSIALAGKRLVGQMPERFLPLGLRFLDFFLHLPSSFVSD